MAEPPGRRSQRLKPAADVSQSRERQSAVRYAGSERRVQEADARLSELERYHADYQQNFKRRATAGLGVRQLQEYQTFMAKLMGAVEAQRRLRDQLALERERERVALTAAATRRRALGKLVETAHSEEQKMEARRTQRETDERAQRGRRGDA